MWPSRGTSRPLKTHYSYQLSVVFWVGGALGNILTSVVSNSYFGKRLVARDITSLGSHVDPHDSENADYYL